MREILGDKAFEGREPLLRAALGGERTFYASEIEHATRGHVAVQSDYVPWADPGGAVRGIIILFEDVTEQRVAERALRESEERFRRIANSAPALSSSGTGSYRRSPCVYSAAAHKEAAPETCSSAAKFGAFSKRLP
jgi:PAS domain-containing protein